MTKKCFDTFKDGRIYRAKIKVRKTNQFNQWAVPIEEHEIMWKYVWVYAYNTHWNGNSMPIREEDIVDIYPQK